MFILPIKDQNLSGFPMDVTSPEKTDNFQNIAMSKWKVNWRNFGAYTS